MTTTTTTIDITIEHEEWTKALPDYEEIMNQSIKGTLKATDTKQNSEISPEISIVLADNAFKKCPSNTDGC